MSRVKVNKIEARSGNNVAFEDPMQLKSVTTTQRDALSSPQAGDTIYNTTTSKIEFYDGSAWQQGGGVDAFSIEYLVIAGGGGGNTNDDTTHGSGGAGGYLCNVSGENSGGNTSAQPALFIPKSTNLQVSVGAGGGLNSAGSKSEFTSIMSVGGGTPRVASYNKCGSAAGPNGCLLYTSPSQRDNRQSRMTSSA